MRLSASCNSWVREAKKSVIESEQNLGNFVHSCVMRLLCPLFYASCVCTVCSVYVVFVSALEHFDGRRRSARKKRPAEKSAPVTWNLKILFKDIWIVNLLTLGRDRGKNIYAHTHTHTHTDTETQIKWRTFVTPVRGQRRKNKVYHQSQHQPWM